MIKPDIALMEAFYQKWQETLSKVKDSEVLIFSFGFHPITQALLEESQKAGGNAMDIPPSELSRSILPGSWPKMTSASSQKLRIL